MKHYQGNRIKKDKMGRKCSTCKRDEKYKVPFRSPVFGWKGKSKESNWSVNWIKLAHYRVQCQALVREKKISLELDDRDVNVNQLKHYQLFTLPWTLFAVSNHVAGLCYCCKTVNYKAQFELCARRRKMIRGFCKGRTTLRR
jgi:hypothetical protein